MLNSKRLFGGLAALLLALCLLAGCGGDTEARLLTYQNYTFNLDTGALNAMENGRTRRLGKLSPLIWCEAEQQGSWNEPATFSVKPTPAGNYLFVGYGTGSGALSFHYQLAALIPAAGGTAQTYLDNDIMDTLPQPFWQGDNLWLPDKGGPVCLNEVTGEAVQYTQWPGGRCWWANDRLLLLGGSTDFLFYDRQADKLLSLRESLLTAELQGEVNALLQADDPRAYPTEQSFAYVWANFGNTYLFGASEPVPYLNYAGEENGQFAFELCCHYYSKARNGIDIAVFPLYITVEQVMELLTAG